MKRAIATPPGEDTLYEDLSPEEIATIQKEWAKPPKPREQSREELLLEAVQTLLQESQSPKKAVLLQKLEKFNGA